MATMKRSAFFKGTQVIDTPVPNRKGIVLTKIISHTFTEAVNTTDILEIFPIFPFGKIVAFDFVSENLGSITLDFGIVSGNAGDPDTARTMGAELLNDAAAGTPAASTLLALSALQGGVGDRTASIGLIPSADITAAANKKVHIRVSIES